MEQVHIFTFLAIYVSDNLTWTMNTSATVKKDQQHLHFLRLLRSHGFNKQLLLTFYRSAVESVLVYGITVWYAACSAADKTGAPSAEGNQQAQ